jgi:hypothetical protein
VYWFTKVKVSQGCLNSVDIKLRKRKFPCDETVIFTTPVIRNNGLIEQDIAQVLPNQSK